MAVYLACMVNLRCNDKPGCVCTDNRGAGGFLSSVCTDIQLKYLPTGGANAPSYSNSLRKAFCMGCLQIVESGNP